LDDLGLTELARELTEIAGWKVSIMLYRTVEDVLARGPSITVSAP
jgi:hypothetical protein